MWKRRSWKGLQAGCSDLFLHKPIRAARLMLRLERSFGLLGIFKFCQQCLHCSTSGYVGAFSAVKKGCVVTPGVTATGVSCLGTRVCFYVYGCGSICVFVNTVICTHNTYGSMSTSLHQYALFTCKCMCAKVNMGTRVCV